MEKLDGHNNNWYVISNGSNLTSRLNFRLTDVLGHVVTTNAITNISASSTHNTGVNFPD